MVCGGVMAAWGRSQEFTGVFPGTAGRGAGTEIVDIWTELHSYFVPAAPGVSAFQWH